eukprot:33250-Chlamydomonas_euryale.AAC.7
MAAEMLVEYQSRVKLHKPVDIMHHFAVNCVKRREVFMKTFDDLADSFTKPSGRNTSIAFMIAMRSRRDA